LLGNIEGRIKDWTPTAMYCQKKKKQKKVAFLAGVSHVGLKDK
jgi:hypothetical protein